MHITMRFLTFVAFRQLAARPWQSFLLVLSVALGVAILTTALSLTNGFEGDLTERLLGTTPHVALHDPLALDRLENHAALRERLLAHPGVRSVSPFIQGQALVATSWKAVKGALVRGVDPAVERQNPAWRRYLVAGSLHDAPDGAGIVLGKEFARQMSLSIGERAFVVTGLGKRHPVRVTGLFESGLHDIDANVVFLTLPTAQAVYGLGMSVTGLGLQVDDVFAAPRLARELGDALALDARPWTAQNRNLLEAMALERLVIFIVIMFIVLVAMIGVGSTMAMWVIEKNREISLLRAVGTSARRVGLLFVVQGGAIALTGVALGAFGGYALSTALTVFPVRLLGDVYFISRLPVKMELRDFALVALATMALSPIASVLPAWRAMRLDPIDAIRRT